MTITKTEHPDPKTVHRRAMRMQILLPVGLVVLLIVALLLVLTPLSPRGLSLVADLMMISMCLLPLLICLLPLYFLMIAVVVLMTRAGNITTKQVRRLRVATTNLNEKTRTTTDTINRKTVNMSARFAPLDRLFSIFDRPEKTE